VRLLYTGLFYLAIPFVLARLAWRGRKEPAYRLRWRERFALYERKPVPGVIWIHAVSVGEAEAAFPLARALARRFPERPLLLTTTTPAGSARVRAALGDSVQHVYLPYDLPDCIDRFFAAFRPVLAVIMETEIWPNLFIACGRRGIPLCIANARLSARSARGYARLAGFTRLALAPVALIAAQTRADAERYLALGASERQVRVIGNIKFDLELPEDLPARARELRARFGARPAWIAASTHEGEETQILQAFARARAARPDLLLVLAPRHPQRFEAVAQLCRSAGWSAARRSEDAAPANADVFLLDAMGELKTHFFAGDIAFVGGSLVPTGGHNVLEPASAGLPVLFGPHMFNFEEAGRKLLEAGGAQQIADAGELAERVEALLADDDLRKTMGERGRAFVAAGRGALERLADSLAELLTGAENPAAKRPER
jgi:3-deoxy-D-manno-octulosonic-acid transferase